MCNISKYLTALKLNFNIEIRQELSLKKVKINELHIKKAEKNPAKKGGLPLKNKGDLIVKVKANSGLPLYACF
ncbi:hypothetical protein GCM10022259_14860 [Aquimarina mytili]